MFTRRSLRAFAVAAALGAGALTTGMTAASAASSTLDQQQPDQGAGGFRFICAIQTLAQTFTAGLSGELDRVEVTLRWHGSENPGPLTATIETVDGTGTPTGVVLGNGSTTTTEAGLQPEQSAWVEIPLTDPALVTADTQYALVLKSAGNCPDHSPSYGAWGWNVASTPDPYPGGVAMAKSSAWQALSHDHAFKTYVLVPTDSGCKVLGIRLPSILCRLV